ncbi:Uncharacterized protein C36E8.1 [Toxocara canis]|uniref:Uncharacterized protein C36E8.1 n=1 Tax=Toxocara canis TaxID=6265 RepID=A0A0B2V8W6_TOXCA|nr:Uncharacterized protein C36E8.1 [Toxocara canis]
MTASVEADSVTGEAIILDFKAGKAAGIATYDKLCKAVDLMGRWQPDAITHFIEQFVDIAHLLDASCKLLVKKLARIEWHIVPLCTRERFVNLLRELCIQHVCHTETVLACFIEHFATKIRAGNPADGRTVKLVPKLVRRCYPHFSQPYLRYESFVRNALVLSEYVVDVRADIWSIIFDHLAQIDAMISKRVEARIIREDQDSNDSSGVFLLEEENGAQRMAVLHEDEKSNDRIDKIDVCLCYIFSYIAKAYEIPLPPEIGESAEWLPTKCSKDGLTMQLRTIFEEQVLMAHDVKHVSFVWLFSCSIEPDCMKAMLQWLWSFITCPGQSPNDWKKAQGASCYMGAFLSRSASIDLSTSMQWMERMMRWCRSYLNEVMDRSNAATAGTLRHGTFYALCQALLLAFCFRYKEIVDSNELEAVRQWGFGHIVHSALEPLTFISRPVAQCFATISRSLQLVYCNHILPAGFSEEKLPFEPLFPFDTYFLTRSSVFVKPLLRRFSPLAEDVGILKRELRYHHAGTISGEVRFKSSDEAEGSLDFLNDLVRDRDLLNESFERSAALSGSRCSKEIGEMLTVYSTSPGLRHFDVASSLMDIN